jgi:hypothetical protein
MASHLPAVAAPHHDTTHNTGKAAAAAAAAAAGALGRSCQRHRSWRHCWRQLLPRAPLLQPRLLLQLAATAMALTAVLARQQPQRQRQRQRRQRRQRGGACWQRRMAPVTLGALSLCRWSSCSACFLSGWTRSRPRRCSSCCPARAWWCAHPQVCCVCVCVRQRCHGLPAQQLQQLACVGHCRTCVCRHTHNNTRHDTTHHSTPHTAHHNTPQHTTQHTT